MTFVVSPLAGASPSARTLTAYIRLSRNSRCWERGCKRAGSSPRKFPTNKIFLPQILGSGPMFSTRLISSARHSSTVFRLLKPPVEGRKILLVGRFSKPQTGGTNNSKHALLVRQKNVREKMKVPRRFLSGSRSICRTLNLREKSFTVPRA